ncbi:hypothetical protein WJX72_006312 [[Myrmecia] bisecta]|uniref:Uncharacterized protein n=1 Tax=[Myrmecia] bisecta TaxID=41462 RepID=A0AAW1R6X8_9CHLO
MWRWLGSEATADSPGPRLHRSPSSSDVLRVEQPQQPLFRLAGPLWSFVHEEDAATWAASCHVGTLSPTYKQLLASVSKQLPEVEGTALVINLGPAIADASAYALLGNNVIETTHPPKVPHFDAPPGLACIPLAVMFLVCSNAASWLCLSDKHIVVLHARCCSDSRSAAALVRFLAACYLTFCQEFSSVEEALLVLPSCSDSTQAWSRCWPPDNSLKTQWAGSGGSTQVHWAIAAAICRVLGPQMKALLESPSWSSMSVAAKSGLASLLHREGWCRSRLGFQ